MDLEYFNGILFIRIKYLDNKTYNKFIYINKVLNKYRIEYVIVNLNNIKRDSNLFNDLLCIRNLLKKWGGKLYLCGVKNNSAFNVISSEKAALKIIRGE